MPEINFANPLWLWKLYADWWRMCYKASGVDTMHGAMIQGILDGALRPVKRDEQSKK